MTNASAFQTYFNYRHDLEFPAVDLGEQLKCTVEQFARNEDFPLSVTLDELDGSLLVTVDFDRAQLDPDLVRHFAADFLAELRSPFGRRPPSVKGPVGWALSASPLLPRIFGHPPDRPALQRADGRLVSYRQLERAVASRAARLRPFLDRPADGAGALVGLVLGRNEMVPWQLAVLSCGAAFCPLDVHTPDAHLRQQLKRLRAAVLVTRPDIQALPTDSPVLVDEQDDDSEVGTLQLALFGNRSLAYAIFTSGSTGAPKLVHVEMGQLCAFVESAMGEFELGAQSVVGHSVSTTFDVSLFNIYATLSAGGLLVQKPEIRHFVECEQQLTHLFLTSALFNRLSTQQAKALNTDWLIVGGETPSAARLRSFLSSGRRASQIYGPTETVVWVAAKHYVDGQVADGRNIGK